jgi:HD-like signal output (HDOD) protein
MGTMRSLVLSAHVFSSFDQVDLKGFSLNRLWEHAIRTGRIAQGISEQEFVPSADAEEAHIAGMLHEVGKLMLAGGRPELFQETLALAAADKIPLPQAELKIFGATHAGVAAYLFGLWGLPASIVEAVAFHLTPARSDVRSFTPLTAVHVASVLNHEMFQDEAGTDTLQFDMDYLASTGLKSRLDVWRAEAAQLARKGKN